MYARAALQRALKEGLGGDDVLTARKRVGWLEDRMERLLGKKRQRVCRFFCSETVHLIKYSVKAMTTFSDSSSFMLGQSHSQRMHTNRIMICFSDF